MVLSIFELVVEEELNRWLTEQAATWVQLCFYKQHFRAGALDSRLFDSKVQLCYLITFKKLLNYSFRKNIGLNTLFLNPPIHSLPTHFLQDYIKMHFNLVYACNPFQMQSIS